MWLWSIRLYGKPRAVHDFQDYVDLRERDTGSDERRGVCDVECEPDRRSAPPSGCRGCGCPRTPFRSCGSGPIAGRDVSPLRRRRRGCVVVPRARTVDAALRRRSRSLVGRVLTLNSANYTIVGVLPRAFVFPIRDAELAVPIVEAEARRVEGDVGFLRLILGGFVPMCRGPGRSRR